MRTAIIRMLHDVTMLMLVVVLESWRFTGVPWHEYLSLALAAAVFVHLLQQRSWVVSHLMRKRQLATRRDQVNVALNILMFAAMVAATASGLFASKVVWVHPTASIDGFQRWHEVHGYTGTWLQWLVALHLAVNWTPIVKRARMIASRAASGPLLRGSRRRLAVFGCWIVVASAGITLLSMGAQAMIPGAGLVVIDRGDGRGLQPATREEVVGIRPGQDAPNPDGFRRFALGLVVTGVAAALARTALRLRL